MSTLPNPALTDALYNWAQGSLPDEAAVALLEVHGIWLRRSQFSEACIEDYTDDDGAVIGAFIDWDRIPEFAAIAPASSSETQMLLIAAELASTVTDVSLCDLIIGLDHTNTAFVLDAIAHTAGWHERHHTHTVTGHVDIEDWR